MNRERIFQIQGAAHLEVHIRHVDRLARMKPSAVLDVDHARTIDGMAHVQRLVGCNLDVQGVAVEVKCGPVNGVGIHVNGRVRTEIVMGKVH